MNGVNGSDQLTPAERIGACDCLVELVMPWIQQPWPSLADAQRSEVIDALCLYVSQMRHRDPASMDLERRRWLERIVARLCMDHPESRAYAATMQRNVEQLTVRAMLLYHEWREQVAPVIKGKRAHQ